MSWLRSNGREKTNGWFSGQLDQIIFLILTSTTRKISRLVYGFFLNLRGNPSQAKKIQFADTNDQT